MLTKDLPPLHHLQCTIYCQYSPCSHCWVVDACVIHCEESFLQSVIACRAVLSNGGKAQQPSWMLLGTCTWSTSVDKPLNLEQTCIAHSRARCTGICKMEAGNVTAVS